MDFKRIGNCDDVLTILKLSPRGVVRLSYLLVKIVTFSQQRQYVSARSNANQVSFYFILVGGSPVCRLSCIHD